MKFSRIGNKIINIDRIERVIQQIVSLREEGYSQSQVARALGVERSFVSKLEGIGEVRRGKKIALLGFPIKNKEEILELGRKYALDYLLVMTEEERWAFLEEKSGLELFNEIIEIMVKLKEFDLIIFIGSDMRLDLMEKLIEGNIIGIELGKSPLKQDQYVDIERIEKIIKSFI
ncbi:MAG: transcriptional regulator [Halanaerobiales bacterium]